MSDLKDQLIRLGAERPDLRKDIRPVLAELGRVASSDGYLLLTQDLRCWFDLPTGELRLSGLMDDAKWCRDQVLTFLRAVAEVTGGTPYVGDLAVRSGKPGDRGTVVLWSLTPAGIKGGRALTAEELEPIVKKIRSPFKVTVTGPGPPPKWSPLK